MQPYVDGPGTKQIASRAASRILVAPVRVLQPQVNLNPKLYFLGPAILQESLQFYRAT